MRKWVKMKIEEKLAIPWIRLSLSTKQIIEDAGVRCGEQASGDEEGGSLKHLSMLQSEKSSRV